MPSPAPHDLHEACFEVLDAGDQLIERLEQPARADAPRIDAIAARWRTASQRLHAALEQQESTP